jgi:hypothetical protein
MGQKSIRDYDSIADRIRLHRQADRRGILVIEGESDERFIERLAPGRWAFFRAGTRNVVISTVEEVTSLEVERVAGLIDQDFDGIVSKLGGRGLPIFSYDNADVESYLFMTPASTYLIEELASAGKLGTYGGPDAVRRVAISVAHEIAALRISNATNGWGLPFDNVDLAKKVDRNTLSLKRTSYCQALTENLREAVHHTYLCDIIEDHLDSIARLQKPPYFRGKDALAVVGVALKSKIGNADSGVTGFEHLAGVLRLSAPSSLVTAPPFPEIAAEIDLA